MIRIAVNNRPTYQTTTYSLLVSELGSLDRIKLSYDYVRNRFEGRYPEHIVTSLEYLGPSRCKRYAQFKVEYKAYGNVS